MGRYRAEIERDFLDAYSDDFLRDVARALSAAYRAAYEECRVNYPPPIAHNLYPQVRYAMIERELLAIAENYAEIAASSEPNYTGTNYYTLLSSNNVFLTANAVVIRTGSFATRDSVTPTRERAPRTCLANRPKRATSCTGYCCTDPR